MDKARTTAVQSMDVRTGTGVRWFHQSQSRLTVKANRGLRSADCYRMFAFATGVRVRFQRSASLLPQSQRARQSFKYAQHASLDELIHDGDCVGASNLLSLIYSFRCGGETKEVGECSLMVW